MKIIFKKMSDMLNDGTFISFGDTCFDPNIMGIFITKDMFYLFDGKEHNVDVILEKYSYLIANINNKELYISKKWIDKILPNKEFVVSYNDLLYLFERHI